MANEVKNVNTLTHAQMKNVNTLTDANLKKLNLLEFTGSVDPNVLSITNNEYESGDTHGPSMAYDEDNDVLGVCYGDDNNNEYPTVRLASISGSTLTWGTAVVIESSAMSGITGIAYDTGNNRFVCGTVNAGARNQPKVLGVSTNTSGDPLIDNESSLVTIHSPASGKYAGFSPLRNFLIYDPAGSRTLAYFMKDDTNSGEDAVLSSITFDDVGTDNTVSASSLQTVEDHDGSYQADSNYCYDSTANKIVRVGQDKSAGAHKLTAQVISGTGDTITVNSVDTYADLSIAVHNENHGGSSLARMRMDNSGRLCHANGVNHFLFWDDAANDFVVSNFSVSGTTATWTESGGSAVKSEGIMSEHSGNLTQGKTSGWGTSDYGTIGMGASSGRNRLVIFGMEGTGSHDTNAAVFEYDSGTYTYKGSLLQVVASNSYENVDSSGWQSSDTNGFLANHVIGTGRPQDDSGGRVWAVDPGNA